MSLCIILGIVPLFCEKIFKQIDEAKAGGDTTEFQIIFSMLEIYNEEARDLLVKSNRKGGMKIRENPATGFYGKSHYPNKILPSSSWILLQNLKN